MTACKCGCGGEVREGRKFMPGHYAKWRSAQVQKNRLKDTEGEVTLDELVKAAREISKPDLSVQPARSAGDRMDDRTPAGPMDKWHLITFIFLLTIVTAGSSAYFLGLV